MRRAEDQIQRAILGHLALRAVPNSFWFHVPNGGWRSPIEARIFKSLGVKAGIPDVLIVVGGKLYALELKTESGKLTPAQHAVHSMLAAAGAEVATAYGIDQALDWLGRWGVLSDRVKL